MNFLWILLAIGFVWLRVRQTRVTGEIELLSDRLNDLERELRRLTAPQAHPDAGAVPELSPRLTPVLKPPEPVAINAPTSAHPPILSPVPFTPGPPEQPGFERPPFAPPRREMARGATDPRDPLPFVPIAAPDADKAITPEPEFPEGSIAAGNWERFMGGKLFAWIGGLAFFIGMALLIKHSFENNLVPPWLRIALGYATGLGLIAGGILIRQHKYSVLSQTLCATGTVTLYAATFAAHALYHFTGSALAFLLMGLITVGAILLSVRLDARVVAVLGVLGGFLTPLLISTGEDRPLALFGYIAILNIGLISVALRQRWDFLVLLGAAGTVLMQLGWALRFFEEDKVYVALQIFLGFDLLFAGAYGIAQARDRAGRLLGIAALVLPSATYLFALGLLFHSGVNSRPGVVFSFVLGADLCFIALAWLNRELGKGQLASGLITFLLLALWTVKSLSADLLGWALGLYAVFAGLHTFLPWFIPRLRVSFTPIGGIHFFPAFALMLVMVPFLRFPELSWIVWPFILLVDFAAISLSILTVSIVPVLGVLVLTGALAAMWILNVPSADSLGGMLGIVGGFGFFFSIGTLVAENLITRLNPDSTVTADRPNAGAQIAAISATLPFLLLILVVLRLDLPNPSPVFALAAVLGVLLLAMSRFLGLDLLAPIALGAVAGLEHIWHFDQVRPQTPGLTLGWSLAFSGLFFAYPFLAGRSLQTRPLAWATAALAPVLHFFLIHTAITKGYAMSYPGIAPALLAIPLLLALRYVFIHFPKDLPSRQPALAWCGGCALFFITLIFPVQFERQWITVGWAIEGMALIWLYQRVPHPGLRGTGAVLLAAAFIRLAFNPAVLAYHERSDLKILNWYLYTYGIVTICLLISAKLLAPPRHQISNIDLPPWLYGAGAVLAFLLLNIEIADFFSEGPTLAFQFSGSLARGMTYSISWALYALLILGIGIWKEARAARYAGLGLLSGTLLKLFLYDLSQLNQLYRIGAFLGVAVILIAASFLYQRYVTFASRK
jgi:uncharacterized membrane protein